MRTNTCLALLAVVVALLAPVGALAQAAPAKSKIPSTRTVNNKPLAAGVKAASSMAPFSTNNCGICHVSSDPKNVGGTKKVGNQLCYGCHEEFQEIMERRVKHSPATVACVNCHNPHNSTEKKLLHEEQTAGCFDCHKAIMAAAENAKVKHGAITTGKKCANCHNPHGANIEKLLTALPFDQCVGCHSDDNKKDWDGVQLTNFKTYLEENTVWHKPVIGKDCSACHRTHGGNNYRLLVADFPKKFYVPYDLKQYALCYGCHNDKVVSAEQTMTLTNFRDGTKNLHYVHVRNQDERGRTCRACHDVHAAKQQQRIRDGVPYGGWFLKINFTRTPTGGSCTKTCHEAKTYSRTVPSTVAKAK
ncbi:MAG TPA: cytochrome c3 family protein [Anaeromyxobacteraceae bacterium]|nr:cytochrome c3 family protein [Anaeromyxobacteraceae bacterium]